MQKFLIILLLFLNIHIIYLCDKNCKKYYYDYDDYCVCEACKEGYYLEKENCYMNLCVEGENEDSCLMCSSDGRCLSCFSDNYSVYDRYQCKKAFLMCGNNTMNNCEKCEIVNNTETGYCEKCYSHYALINKNCTYNYSNIESINLKKSFINFIILIILLVN